METFQKTYGNFVVDFNNSNEYIEMGSLDENPEFAGILIRKQFTREGVELSISQIKFFLKELSKITYYDKNNPLIKMIHEYGWNNYHSDFVIVISDYQGIRCKFFTNISHQYNMDFTAIETHSPEFKLETIIQILKDAHDLL